MKLLLPILCLALAGCGHTRTFSDGSKLRVDFFHSPIAPSVTAVSTRSAGTTNWSAPVAFSGAGLLPSVASGVSTIIPIDRNDSGGNVNVTTTSASAPALPRPAPNWPPGHRPKPPKDGGNRGR